MLLRCSFAGSGRVARRSAEAHFDSVWASRNEVRRFRAQVKNQRKIVPHTLLARVARKARRKRFLVDISVANASVKPHFDSPIPSRNEGRALVERFDSLERRITAEAPKSTLPSPQNRSKIDRERSSDDSERLQSRSWLDRGPLDALPESMLARSSGPEAILARSGASTPSVID